MTWGFSHTLGAWEPGGFDSAQPPSKEAFSHSLGAWESGRIAKINLAQRHEGLWIDTVAVSPRLCARS